jgi:FAD/FMN-containing dehydrogenase
VKNVTGYDLPRVIVGSHGTLGVLVAVTVRAQPLPATSQWFLSDVTIDETWRRLFRPTAVLWDGDRVHVLLEGDPGDVAAQSAALRASPVDPPQLPNGAHRGRISCSPARLASLGARLDVIDVVWAAEVGVGTVHVAGEHEDALADARDAARAEGGWLLRESGAPGLDGFGVPLPNAGIMRRVKDSLDPAGKMNPGRLPYGAAVPA